MAYLYNEDNGSVAPIGGNPGGSGGGGGALPTASATPPDSTIAQYMPASPVWSVGAQLQAQQAMMKGPSTVKTKGAIILGIVLLAAIAFGQTDNTLYVKSFPGATVGAKLSAAMGACNSNTSIPCILTLDPSLAAWPQGTMPALCAQCSLNDLRKGAPVGSILVGANNFPGADGGTKLNAAITAACAAGVRVVDARGFGAGNQTVSSTVSLGCGTGPTVEVLLDQSTHWVPATSSLDMFLVMPGGLVHNLAVDVTGVAGYSGNAVKLAGNAYGNQPGDATGPRTQLDGYNFYGTGNTTATALLLSSIGASTPIQFADFYNVNISGGLNAVLLSSSGTGSWVTGNNFYNLKQTGAVHGVEMISSATGSVTGNTFIGYQAEIGSNVLDYIWITGTGSCNGNDFSDFFEWDMNAPTTSQHTVLIDANCGENRIEGFLGEYAGSPYPWIVTDSNGNNYMFNRQSGTTWGQRTFNNSVNATMFNATTYTTGFQFNGHTFLTSDGSSTFLQPMAGAGLGDVVLGSEYSGPNFWGMDGSGNFKNKNGVILPLGVTGSTGPATGKVVLTTGTGYSGTCASTTTLTVVDGIISGCI